MRKENHTLKTGTEILWVAPYHKGAWKLGVHCISHAVTVKEKKVHTIRTVSISPYTRVRRRCRLRAICCCCWRISVSLEPFPPPGFNFDQKPGEGRLALLVLRVKNNRLRGEMTGRETKKLTRERGAWFQKGSHDVKRDDDEMRSEGGLERRKA
jgi:hypothetical protein